MPPKNVIPNLTERFLIQDIVEMPQKKKAIIFGAGGGGQKLHTNCNETFDFVAYSDNDSRAHGKMINQLTVVSPDTIQNIHFDIIVIASMWVQEIRDQLIALGIPEEKIYIPEKNLLKHGIPFADAKTRSFARKVIFALSGFADRNGFTLYLDCGTLLGFVRQGDILEWDDDIDLALNDVEFEKFEPLLPELRKQLPVEGAMKWSGLLLQGADGEKFGVSLECIPEKNGSELKPFDIFIQSNRRENGFSRPMIGAFESLDIPEHFFDGYDALVFPEGRLKAPRSYTQYLELLYGDWKTPRKRSDFSSYAPVRLASSSDNEVSISLQKKVVF